MKIVITPVVKYQSLRLAQRLLVAQLTILFVEAVWIAMRPLNMNILQIALGIRPLRTARGSGGYISKITMSITRINGLHKIKHAESNKKNMFSLYLETNEDSEQFMELVLRPWLFIRNHE